MINYKSLGRIVGLLAMCYLAASAYLFFTQTGRIFPSPKEGIATPADWGMRYEEITIKSQDNLLKGWWIPGEEKAPVLIFFHGNGSNIHDLEGRARLLGALQWGMVFFDYRGYGQSQGEASEEGVYDDALAVRDYLLVALGVKGERLIYYGHSLGGAVATWLAVRHPPLGLVLEGAFTSLPDLAADYYPYLPVRILARYVLDSAARMESIHRPILVIHSADDMVVPFRHGERLFALAGEPKRMVTVQGSHNDGFVSLGKRGAEEIREFFK